MLAIRGGLSLIGKPAATCSNEGEDFNLGERRRQSLAFAERWDQVALRDPFAYGAFILVFAHRFFAVTDDEGRYRLEGVPPGTYTLAVWNETVRGDPPRRTVTIGDAGGDVEVDFSIR